MSSALGPGDRKLLIATAAALVLLVIFSVAIGPRSHVEQSPVPSTYSSSSHGARAAYLLLKDLNYPVRRWEESPEQLPDVGRGSVLILAEPTLQPSRSERQSLSQFVQSGGRILFCGDAIRFFFVTAKLSKTVRGSEWQRFAAYLPSYLSRGAQNIVMQPQAYWSKSTSATLTIYGDPKAPIVIAWRIGAGEVVWWAGATPLSNAGIREANNLQLFLNAISGASPDAPPLNVYWDEYFHGQRGSLWSYAATPPILWGLAQTGLIIAAALFTFSRRWGPIVSSVTVSRLSPLEFVDTLGGLYERARASSVAVDVSYRHLRLNVTQKLGLPSTASDVMIASAASQRLGWNNQKLLNLLQRAESAIGQSTVSPTAALAIVRDMESYTSRLATRQRPPTENN